VTFMVFLGVFSVLPACSLFSPEKHTGTGPWPAASLAARPLGTAAGFQPEPSAGHLRGMVQGSEPETSDLSSSHQPGQCHPGGGLAPLIPMRRFS
jgi:hypothetical protein